MNRPVRRKLAMFSAVGLMAGLGLVACGSDETDKRDETPTTEAMMEETPTTDAMMDETPTTDAMMDETPTTDAMMDETPTP